MFDTPGVPHTHQISSLLNPDEVTLFELIFPGESSMYMHSKELQKKYISCH